MSASRHTSTRSAGTRMGQRDRGVDAFAAEQQHHRQADQRRAADDDGPLADRRDRRSAEQPHHTERRAADVTRLAAHETAHRRLGQPVDVLLGRDHAQHRLRVEVAGQRQLAEDAVHRRVGSQRGDDVLELGLADVAVDRHVARLHAGLGRLLLLAADVDLAGLVVADQHRGQAHRRRCRRPRSRRAARRRSRRAAGRRP